jgi:hypothetical protein
LSERTTMAATGLRHSPVAFLSAISFANWVGYAAWSALFNNFAKEMGGFSGFDIGVAQSVREIPGFLAFTAIVLFLYMREQTLAYLSLILLALGIAATGYFPGFIGILITTFVMSLGFHYLETANQALSLQLLPKAEAPALLGRIASFSAGGQFLAFGAVALAWWIFKPGWIALFLAAGILTFAITAWSILYFPRFQGDVPQHKGFVLRRRYWLYYVMTFLSGARRQIFMAFGAFLLVERFGFEVSGVAILMLATTALTVLSAPWLGTMIGKIGERTTILMENAVLLMVFLGYAFTTIGWIAAGLFVLDGVFFTLVIAQRTYFQKIADPADIAPTAAVAFTINHIAAVSLPVLFGLVWLKNPALVFQLGAAIAVASFAFALLVPRAPGPGRETTLAEAKPAVSPAE